MLYDSLKGFLLQTKWHLSQKDFFQGIPEERTRALARASKRAFSKGEFIFQEDDPSPSCFYLEKGVVRIYKITAEGKEPMFFLRKAGDMFGLAEVVAEVGRKCNAQAILPCVIHEISKPDLDALMDDSPAISRRIVEILGQRIRFLGEQIENLMACDVATRLLKLLLYLGYERIEDEQSLEQPIPLPFSLTQEQIASMTGSCQQTVSEVLKKLQGEGLVRVTRKNITLLNPLEIVRRIH